MYPKRLFRVHIQQTCTQNSLFGYTSPKGSGFFAYLCRNKFICEFGRSGRNHYQDMIKQTLPYIPPAYQGWYTPTSNELYEQARELHQQGEHHKAIHKLVEALVSPEQTIQDFVDKSAEAEGRLGFSFPHKGYLIHMQEVGQELHLWLDFMHIPEANRVAALRYSLELNSARLMLARVALRDGDRLVIEYRTPIKQTAPEKLYNLLTNISNVAYTWGQTFIDKFGTTPLEPISKQAKTYSSDEVARMHRDVQTISERTLAGLKVYMDDRRYGSAWLLISIAFFLIRYSLRPEGSLERKIDEALEKLDERIPHAERIQRAIGTLKEIAALTPEELERSLYQTPIFIDPRPCPSEKSLADDFSTVLSEAVAAHQGKAYDKAILVCQHAIYKLYSNCEVYPNIDAHLSSALAKASERSLEEQSKIFCQAINQLVDGELPSTPSGQSWWRRLLGFFKD